MLRWIKYISALYRLPACEKHCEQLACSLAAETIRTQQAWDQYRTAFDNYARNEHELSQAKEKIAELENYIDSCVDSPQSTILAKLIAPSKTPEIDAFAASCITPKPTGKEEVIEIDEDGTVHPALCEHCGKPLPLPPQKGST